MRCGNLADDRDRREGRPDNADAEYDAGEGMLRVAPADDPTRTAWIPIDADAQVTRPRPGGFPFGCVVPASGGE